MPFTQLDHVELVRAGDGPGSVEVLRRYTQREAVAHVQELDRQRRADGPSVVQRSVAAIRARLDPNYAEARRLRRDPNYRPVRSFTVEEAVARGLLPPLEQRISELDRLLAQAPVEQLDGNIAAPRALPSLGWEGEVPPQPRGSIPPRT